MLVGVIKTVNVKRREWGDRKEGIERKKLHFMCMDFFFFFIEG